MLVEIPRGEVPVTCKCGAYMFSVVEKDKLEAIIAAGSTVALAASGKTEA